MNRLDDNRIMIPISKQLWDKLNTLLGPLTHDEFFRKLLGEKAPEPEDNGSWLSIELKPETVSKLYELGYDNDSYDEVVKILLFEHERLCEYLRKDPGPGPLRYINKNEPTVGFIGPPPPIEREVK